MAGGKLTPRQKMINLMYIVFIAMIAITMSKEVLNAFGYINEEINDVTNLRKARNDQGYADLGQKAKEQKLKYADRNKIALEIKAASDDLYAYVEDVKQKMYADLALDDPNDYASMDKGDFLDNYFFAEANGKHGKEYVAKIDAYRELVLSRFKDSTGAGYKAVVDIVKKSFNTDKVKTKDGNKEDYLRYNYEGYPAVASLTKLSTMQSGITRTEEAIYNAMVGAQLRADAGVSASTYEAIFLPEKPTYFPGDRVSGKVVLGRYDENLLPKEVKINGKTIEGRVSGGAALKGEIVAGNVGEQNLKGDFIFIQDGKEVKIPIEQTYSVVAKPNGAVISADKMNVVYRGLQNPLTISVPGVADNKIKVSAPGIRKVSGVGKYVLTPGKGKEVNIVVNYTLPNGSVEKSVKTYRIKSLPKPLTTVRKQSGVVKMSKSSIAKTTIRVEMPDFLFNLTFKIKSFKVKVPGQATITVRGAKLNSQALSAIKRARAGDVITIFDVKSSAVGVNTKIKDALPVSIEVQ